MKLLYIKSIVCLLFSGFLVVDSAQAQLTPLGAQYFANQYLGNPAMAGLKPGLNVSGSLRSQFNSTPGKPVTQAFTAEYQLEEKAGIGFNLYHDEAGILQQTRASGTFAYHLPVGETQKINFGLSVGIMKRSLNRSEIIGNEADPLVSGYNNRETVLDGDFGIGYSSDKLNLQAALPNLKNVFTKEEISTIDRSTFYSAASYIFTLQEGMNGMSLEPKVCYRGIKGMDNIIDAGAELRFANNQLGLMGMYHSTKNATFGLGLNFREYLGIQALYTTETTDINSVSGSNFEINLSFRLFRK